MSPTVRYLAMGLLMLAVAITGPRVAHAQDKSLPPANEEVVLPLPRGAAPPIVALPPYFSPLNIFALRYASPKELKEPKVPEWFPLPQEQEVKVIEILAKWERSNSRIERYRCNFVRWTYDPTFTRPLPKTGELPAKTIGYGEINYAASDKYLFREDKIEHYVHPTAAGGNGRYEVTAGEKGDHWVFDGKSVFLFDYPNKKLVQTEIPAHMFGPETVNNSSPFVYGISAAAIKERFWIRDITPSEMNGEHWLEAYPKLRSDALCFKMIRLIIDVPNNKLDQIVLLKVVAIYDRLPSYQSFSFTDRQVNGDLSDPKHRPFDNDFYKVSIPPDFKQVRVRY